MMFERSSCGPGFAIRITLAISLVWLANCSFLLSNAEVGSMDACPGLKDAVEEDEKVAM
jgi:hypothetical protein